MKFVGLSSKQLPNLLHHYALRLLIVDGDEDRIFACQGSDDFRDARIVNLHGDGRSATRETLRDDQYVSSDIKTQQPARRISICMRQGVRAAMLDHSELFEIAGQTRLGRRHARPLLMPPQGLLGSDPLRADQIEQLLLPFSLQHISCPDSSLYLLQPNTD